MRSFSFRSIELALIVVATVVPSSLARGQACCAGGGAYQPARLKLHEDLLFGVSARFSDQLGTTFPSGSYAGVPSGSGEQDFEEDLLGTVRVFERGQVGVDVPIVETNRYVPGKTDFGGGLGDIALTARWDFLYSDESAHLPGFAVLGGFTFPSGVAPEASTSPLGASATGQGAYQGALGFAFERTFLQRLVANVTLLVYQPLQRQVENTTELLGTQFSGLAAIGWVFPNEAALALTLTTSTSLDARIDGDLQTQTERAVQTLGVAGGLPLNQDWRLQGTAFYDLPVLGRNKIDGTGCSFTVIRAFTL